MLRWSGRDAVAALRAGADAGSPLIVGSPSRVIVARGSEAMGEVSRNCLGGAGDGGWVVLLGYELGRVLEPGARHGATRDGEGDWPECVLARIDSGWRVDQRGAIAPFGNAAKPGEPARRAWSGGDIASGVGRGGFERAVARIVEYIHAGDVYQVNLSHRLTGPFSGCPRSFFAELAGATDPRHGAYLEFESGGERFAIASASPELFLRYEAATRRLSTRPMKGTRPVGAGERELRESEKDKAELSMIVDLMRNDLGRVCELGSVRVDAERDLERHGNETTGVLQTTASVSGVLRAGLGIGDALGATFPPGSVTGAPKIRAMQIIEELEPTRRGPYCGAIGFIADSGDAWFNVAIRTAMLRGRAGAAPGEIADGTLEYSVGAGIVADSSPEAEWEETIVKAGALLGMLGSAGVAER